MAALCEDYPACGHTTEDPCGRQWYDEPGAFDTSIPGNEHALCDHENGECDVDMDDEDYDEDYPHPDSADGRAWQARCAAAGQPDPYGKEA